MCGHDDFVKIARYARAKEPFFRRYLKLPGGIPSHDTFNRLFGRLKPALLQECLVDWLDSLLAGGTGGEIIAVIAIDDKVIRRTIDHSCNTTALDVAKAWVAANRSILDQRALDKSTDEVTSIAELLDVLENERGAVRL